MDSMSPSVGAGAQSVSLVIPCRAEYLALCRLLAGVVGARESLHAEEIADLKLVVTEACTCFLWGPDGAPSPGQEGEAVAPPEAIRVDFDIRPEVWTVTVSDPARLHHIPEGSRWYLSSGGGLGLTIIRALVDSVVHTDSEAEGSVIRVTKNLTAQPA